MEELLDEQTSVEQRVKSKEVCDFFHRCLNEESEEFLRCATRYTLEKRPEKRLGKCGFCQYLFQSANRTRNKNNKSTHEQMLRVCFMATRVPLSLEGMTMLWYYVYKTFEIEDLETAVQLLDAQSLFEHLVVQVCSNYGTICPQLTGAFQRMLRYQSKLCELVSQMEEQADEEEAEEVEGGGVGGGGDSDEAGELEEMECCIINEVQWKQGQPEGQKKQDEGEKVMRQLKDRKKDIVANMKVSLSVLIGDLRKGGCTGYDRSNSSRCLYSNTGQCDMNVNSHTLHEDARHLVHPSWVKTEETDVTVSQYYSCDMYVKKQPGVRTRVSAGGAGNGGGSGLAGGPQPGEKDNTLDINREGEEGMVSLFVVEGEMLDRRRWDAEEAENEAYEMAQRRYRNRAHGVLQELRTLHELHTLCQEHRENFGDIANNFGKDPCLWCCINMSGGARRVLNELACMVRDRLHKQMNHADDWGLVRTGNQAVVSMFTHGTADECEDADKEDRLTQHELRKRGRRGRKQFADDDLHGGKRAKLAGEALEGSYTYGLNGRIFGKEPLEACFDKWSNEKFPFMGEWLQEQSSQFRSHVTDSLLTHLNSNGDIFCICNVRRCFIDSDCHGKRHNVCFLPFIYRVAEMIIETVGVKGTQELLKGPLVQVVARHLMRPCLI